MTMCVSHVDPHIPNIGYMKVYERLQALGGSSLFFLVKFHVECRQSHVWGPPGAQVMSMFVKTYIFGKVELG